MVYKHSTYAMKKLTFMMLLAAFFTLCVTSCSKDDDDNFAYPMEQLYGKWEAVELKVDGKWYDVTKYPYTRFGMDITFYEGGRFYGSGYLGNGSGTFTVSGKTIKTYVNNELYITYSVNSLTASTAYLTLTMGSQSLEMKAEKKY